MDRSEYAYKAAELGFLEKQAAAPGISKLTLMSVQARIEKARAFLEDNGKHAYRPAKVRLTYRGAPVWGTHGVLAEFGASATQAFSVAITAIAASLSGSLADKGPIPNRLANQLLITGPARGSFGFELEEIPADKQLDIEGTTPVSQAIEILAELLEATATKSDEELSEPVSRLADRAIAAVSDFLSELSENNASCGVATSTRRFQFSDVEQVRRSKARLSRDNIKEEQETFTGSFVGVLPDKRIFEFKTTGGEVLHGRVSAEIGGPNVINDHLYTEVSIHVTARRIGSSNPRYTLKALPWS
ncbi:hypothetical protein [Pseudomonas sp. SWRI99]|uniref:hypothetical protein n=1 Tax=Pseudomonas sp. SWRI99 TaxID=2745506 RepID=UPI001647A2ED|nr:hypothetical protein [Pseudomonas sp. SWRI99]MBC3779236.1 hypothetical protein [Pseudomonas sp. SWRI99]